MYICDKGIQDILIIFTYKKDGKRIDERGLVLGDMLLLMLMLDDGKLDLRVNTISWRGAAETFKKVR